MLPENDVMVLRSNRYSIIIRYIPPPSHEDTIILISKITCAIQVLHLRPNCRYLRVT